MGFPYYPTYQPYQNQYTPQHGGLIWVQGIEAAKSYPVSAGQSVLLMDSESNAFFIKSADMSGMPLPLRVFDYSERKQHVRATENASAGVSGDSAYITRAEFESRLAAILADKRNIEKEVKNDERTVSDTRNTAAAESA